MSIDFDTFLNWAQAKFDSVKVTGNEVKLNSIFTEDRGNHLWCNPSGGKNHIKNGVYHCWKTDKKGTLVNLVMLVESCDRKKAMDILGITTGAVVAPEEINFDINFGKTSQPINYDIIKEVHLPPHCYEINKAPIYWYNRASEYLKSRKIPLEGLYICTAGKYEGRIVIPYYSKNGKLVYFNGRTITGNNLRYRGPEKEIGVGKEDVIFFTNQPENEAKVYLCEGEFDAITLRTIGLNAAACGGKNLSDKQAILLSQYKICLALDADDAGRNAMNNMYNKLTLFGNGHELTYVAPPRDLKDWNNFYCKYDANLILAYIVQNEKKFEVE